MRKLLLFLALSAGVVALGISSGAVDAAVEWRVKSGLMDAGIGEKRATCMAARMTDRLSILQLRKLQNMEAHDGEAAEPTGLGDYIKRVRRIGDAEVVAVTASSAGLCAIGIG
ncbi:hypothetical protein [Allopontixanthobacter sp.]|uniref:hypothetical protein n=1 Tax=Allopontixanthobacter sp. TaxID=2906452 RepID=UPI002ABC662D|nr:hypothetical protein [Allopontixanthobacter sp.]MDZ4308616.1 hypothetical protein [Allopontixanthobacter sp.]